jgi:hypothetical protein
LFPYGFDDAVDIPNSSAKAGMMVGAGAGGAGYVRSLLDPDNAYLDDSDTPLPTEQVSEAIADPSTWGIDYEQRHQVELTPTAAGGEVLSTASNVYSFRCST